MVRLTRSERLFFEMEIFLNSKAKARTKLLYSSEIKRLNKDFSNQLKITKGDRYRNNLYICTIERIK